MKCGLLSLILCVTLCTGSFAQTRPSNASDLEIRAMEEFNSGKYVTALPMLQKVAEQLKDQPDRLGQIKEDIRVCERNLNVAMTTPPVAPGAPRKVHPAPKAGETIEMAIKDLGNFDFDADKGGNIPDDVKALSGASIRLTGFMIPMDQAESITQFALVPSLFACCFGQPPQLQHTIVVHVPKGKAVSYYPDEIVCDGKLTVEEKKEDGFIVSIFELEVDSVRPTAK